MVYFSTLSPISLNCLVSVSIFPPAWCASDIEAEHRGLQGLSVAVDGYELNVVHGVICQPLHCVPAALGQGPGVRERGQVPEGGACVADHNLLVPGLVRSGQLEL